MYAQYGLGFRPPRGGGPTIHPAPRPERIAVYLKLDATVVDWFRQSDPGYQARINEVLRRFVYGVTDPDHEHSTVEQAQVLFEQFYAQSF